MQKHIFYHPQTGVAADVIPFFHDGTFYLFYLKDERDIPTYGEGVHWFLLTTKDFVHYEDHGIVLPHGSPEDLDFYAFTGCVTQIEDMFYIYYTGHNPRFIEQGKPQEVILRAKSKDLLSWEKDASFTLYAPAEQFEIHDWRDPFVWFDSKDRLYHMIVMARVKEGATRRRGITAHLTSSNATDWELTDRPFYAPSRFNAHECPDFFSMAGNEYLFYSEYSQEKVTRYVTRSIGTTAWQQPIDDHVDGTAFYAAKTACDGQKRYAIGWIPIRLDDSDSGAWQWGGCTCAHEVSCHADGSLKTTLPETIKAAFSERLFHGAINIDCTHGHADHLCCELPSVCLVDIELSIAQAKTIEFLFRASPETQEGTIACLDLLHQRMTVDTWPRDSAKSFEPGLERFVPSISANGKVHLQFLLDGSAGCIYLQDDTVLSYRAYANKGNAFLISTTDAQLDATITVYAMKETKE